MTTAYAIALLFVIVAMLKVCGPMGWRGDNFWGCPACGGKRGHHKSCQWKDS